jgi:hypothetical protein
MQEVALKGSNNKNCGYEEEPRRAIEKKQEEKTSLLASSYGSIQPELDTIEDSAHRPSLVGGAILPSS